MRWLIQGFGTLLTPVAQRFDNALKEPQLAQRQVQKRICDRLIASEYGQSLGIRDLDDWQRVPLVTYDDLEPWILPGLTAIPHSSLTPEAILFYEKTSGTRGPAKWIPYTRSLRHTFSQLFCIWAQDLIRHGPAFSTGKIYFCISPQFVGCANDATSAETPRTGLQNDAEYLDRGLQRLLSPFWVGSQQTQAKTPEQFKWQLCQTLLQTERLETISIWSPSFLTMLLDFIHQHREDLRSSLSLSSQRDRLLREPEIPWTEFWPHLKLISCWDSVAAADSAAALRSRFPGVLVQGKGLLATEAPLTVPLIAAQGYVPLVNQVFFEFEDRVGHCWLLDQLTLGQDYTVVLSQTGGLYRYRLGDRVRVTHFYRNTPCLEFLGRSGGVSDLVGEKLTEPIVQTILDNLGLTGHDFVSVVPIQEPPPHYVLLLARSPMEPTQLAQALEDQLCQLPHYRHARCLGQLAPAQVYVHDHMAEILTQYRGRLGQRWGDIKLSLLMTTLVKNLNELITF